MKKTYKFIIAAAFVCFGCTQIQAQLTWNPYNWLVKQNATKTIADDKLVVINLGTSSANFRADLSYDGGNFVLDAGQPFFALKVKVTNAALIASGNDKSPALNIEWMHRNETGSTTINDLSSLTNKVYTSTYDTDGNDVIDTYIFDLKSIMGDQFVDGLAIPCNNMEWTNGQNAGSYRAQVGIKMIVAPNAGATQGTVSYEIEHIGTFATEQAAIDYFTATPRQPVFFNFQSANNWTTLSNSEYAITDGRHLNCTMALQSNDKYRGDLVYNNSESADVSLNLDPEVDAYLAVKFIGARPNGNMTMELKATDGAVFNPDGWKNTPAGSITTFNGNTIYYYDLTVTGGLTNAVDISKITLKIADAAIEPYSYKIDWIKTFRSVAAITTDKDFQDDGEDDPDEEVVLPPPTVDNSIFVHPGLSHKKSDLDRMKTMVEAQIEPWYSSYNNLKANNKAQYNYTVRGNSSFTRIIQDGENFSAFRDDAKAAYLNAILWAITNDARHAQKCVEIFNAWCNLTCFQGGGTEALNAGRVGWQIIEAAEIIRSTYSGWELADIQKFKDMLVYPGYSTTGVPASVNTNNGTFYWRVYQGDPGRHGNQDLFAWRVVMAMGIFMDNQTMYDRAFRYFTGQTHPENDIPYASGPPVGSSTPSAQTPYLTSYPASTRSTTIPDYGYDGVLKYYIWENGQCEESARDQAHAALGAGMVASMAEIAWNQGTDIYGMYDNRILKGYEWAMRYNVSYNNPYPDQTSPWEPIGYVENDTYDCTEATYENEKFIRRMDRTKRWKSLDVSPYNEAGQTSSITRGAFLISHDRPVYELALAHYNVRAGLPAESTKWTQRALDINGLETLGEGAGVWHDHLGWGGLIFRRTSWMAGDPVSYAGGNRVFGLHQVPGEIKIADFDYYAGSGQNHTYYDTSTGNAGGVYRNDSDVDIQAGDGDYVVYNMSNGEWMSYTIGTSPQNEGYYDIFIRHNTVNSGAKIKLALDGTEYDETFLPVTSGFAETKVATVHLNKGCEVIRIYQTGTDNGTELSRMRIAEANLETPIHIKSTGNTAASVYVKDGYVQISGSHSNRIRQVYVYDLQGELIYTDKGMNVSFHTVRLNNLPDVFIVKIVTDSGVSNVKVINK
jgi:hypothetical protein